MKKAISLLLALVLCLSLCACGEDTPTVPNDTEPSTTVHTHNWKDATCDAPKTCETCGQTEGEKLEHQWERSTCTDPYTCALCNATNGEGDNHSISDGVCRGCGKTLDAREKEPGYQYQVALEMLSGTNEDRMKAHQLLSNLGDYKDATEYLGRFTILPDILLSWTYEETNAFGEIVYTEVLNYDYDHKGNLVKAPCGDYYNYDTVFIVHLLSLEHYEYRYDSNGRLIEQEIGNTITQYEYNEQGVLVKATAKSGENTKSVTEFTYNEAGLCIREDSLYADGSSYYTEYTHDSEGRVLRKRSYNKADAQYINSYAYYEYDEAGKCIKLSKYNGDADDRHSCDYIYESDRVIAVNYHYGDTVLVTNYVYGYYYCYTPAE